MAEPANQNLSGKKIAYDNLKAIFAVVSYLYFSIPSKIWCGQIFAQRKVCFFEAGFLNHFKWGHNLWNKVNISCRTNLSRRYSPFRDWTEGEEKTMRGRRGCGHACPLYVPDWKFDGVPALDEFRNFLEEFRTYCLSNEAQSLFANSDYSFCITKNS